jgi:hypothetical protein
MATISEIIVQVVLLRATRLFVAASALGLASAPAAFDLQSLGAPHFEVDGGATTATYSQNSTSLIFDSSINLGATLGGLFTSGSQDWSLYSKFGLRMTLTGVNPGLPFTVDFFGRDGDQLSIINIYQGQTIALGLTPTVVILDLTLAGTGNFSQVVGMQFTWDGDGAIDTSVTEVVGFDAPATQGMFVARAPGGVSLLTSTNEVAGIELTPAGAWSSLSDSNSKTKIATIDPRELLRQVAALPVTEWYYKHDPNRRYIGPMAQDFRSAFGLGFDDKHISTLDTDGVALSALKGLIEELRERKQRSAEQARRLTELEAELHTLTEKVGSGLPPSE